jgi:cation diffusion facilitator family transporter
MSVKLASGTDLTKYAKLSIAAALATIGLKALAYLLTRSVGLLSDAMESGVNLVGALMALAMLIVAARPADAEHNYGHNKAEYFSSGVEGALILVAALGIIVTAIERLIAPRPLEQIGLGLGISVGASLINLAVALLLRKAGKRHRSIILEADARHLLTDVWTSAGVLVGMGVVAISGWTVLDPVVALLVAANIIWAGVGIVKRSVQGLMDVSLPPEEQDQIRVVLERFASPEVQYHSLRSRRAGTERFVSVHVVVPGNWSVHQGHRLLSSIEDGIGKALTDTTVFTHLEPREDPRPTHDEGLI